MWPDRAAPRSGGRRRRYGRIAVLAVITLVAFSGFALLGNWQLRRRTWKLERIAEANARVHAAPKRAPGRSDWANVGSGPYRYRHVRVTGHYLNEAETLVHGTSSRGYGYWVMTPLRTTRGFTVLVNRGHIPESLPGTRRFREMSRPTGSVTVTGLLRLSKTGGGPLRSNDPAHGQWYSRDVAAIARAGGLPAGDVAPYFIDADATGGAQDLPNAGLTVVRFPNHHLIYAVTWYTMALGVLIGGVIVLRRERSNAPAED
ncbi:MAG TPA: SURF1 family protein [Gammaproteobacteria bacterium]|nr:SURF1 family protein [Gammaproteobacteria bacterium]